MVAHAVLVPFAFESAPEVAGPDLFLFLLPFGLPRGRFPGVSIIIVPPAVSLTARFAPAVDVGVGVVTTTSEAPLIRRSLR